MSAIPFLFVPRSRGETVEVQRKFLGRCCHLGREDDRREAEGLRMFLCWHFPRAGRCWKKSRIAKEAPWMETRIDGFSLGFVTIRDGECEEDAKELGSFL